MVPKTDLTPIYTLPMLFSSELKASMTSRDFEFLKWALNQLSTVFEFSRLNMIMCRFVLF